MLSAALLDPGYLIETETTSARPYDEVLYDAISALPEATRLTNQPMSQTSSGRWEPDPDPRAALPIDWAEFVTRALAGAAANVGSTAKILSGRPGSWEPHGYARSRSRPWAPTSVCSNTAPHRSPSTYGSTPASQAGFA